MRPISTARMTLGLILMAGLLLLNQAWAANYPLELVSPRAAGTAPASGMRAIGSTHRIFRAYPGLEYNIRAVVVGGTYPYTFSLDNAPAGMTINERTGLIVWTNPQSDASPTITVTDSEGTSRSSSWDITVTTSGFHFVDAVNGSSNGDGTLSSPWANLSDITSAPGGDIVYFRAGTYNALDMPRINVGGAWERVGFDGSQMPIAWLAYPGERPIIDFASGPLFRFHSGHIYLDGLETRNSYIQGFQLAGGHYAVFRRLRMRDHNVGGGSLDGTNAAFIMTISAYAGSDGGSPNTWPQYTTIQDSEFVNAPSQNALKIYSLWKLLVEDNLFRDVAAGTSLKADIPQFTYRRNTHVNVRDQGVGGNMNYTTTYGEILFNLFNQPSSTRAVRINQNMVTQRVDIYRNTVIGRLQIESIGSNNGPFRVYNNVIVNNDNGTPSGSHVYASSSAYEFGDNLTGYPSDGLVDSFGALTGNSTRFIGTHGHQLLGDASAPSAPTALLLQTQ